MSAPPARVGRRNSSIDNRTHLLHTGVVPMTPKQFKRWLGRQGCTFEPGKGGHLTVRRGDRVASLPMHGKRDMPTGTMEGIKKALGLKKG